MMTMPTINSGTAKNAPPAGARADTGSGGGTAAGPSSSAPRESRRPPVQQTIIQDVVFNSVEEMEEALRGLRTDMTEEFDDVGMNEFDQVVKQNGGFPKNIAAGEKIFSIAQKVRAELKQLHRKS